MKTYNTNPRFNKAALILDSMSPDMREDIVEYVLYRGRNIAFDLGQDDGGVPKPLAIFSNLFVPYEDFPKTYLGFLTVVLAQLREVGSDYDFYKETLMKAFGLPSQMADALAKKVETYDVLGGGTDKDTRGWLEKIAESTSEAIRQSANWSMSVLHLPFENDQTQKYDLDRLYEFKVLGDVVDDLSSRARLMKGQAMMARSLNVFLAKANEAEAGTGDPEDGDAETLLIGEIASLVQNANMGDPSPNVFGSLAPFAAIGRGSSRRILAQATHHAGLNPKHLPAKVNNSLRNAFNKLKGGKLPLVAKVALGGAGAIGIAKLIGKASQAMRDKGDIESLHGDIAEQYGDIVADAMLSGDVETTLKELMNLAAQSPTTGDPSLDEAIIGDVLGEIISEGGDPEDGDAEIGGILRRARINRAVKRGQRRKRKMSKKRAKIRNRNAEHEALIRERSQARSHFLSSDDDLGSTDEEPEYDSPPEDSYDQGSGFDDFPE